MDDMHTRWLPVSADILPDGKPVTLHRGGRAIWLVDGAAIDPRLLPMMGRLGSAIKKTLKLLSEPTEEPFGEMRLMREDIGLCEMDETQWTATATGIIIPVPRGLISARLVDDVCLSATEQLRWTAPLG